MRRPTVHLVLGWVAVLGGVAAIGLALLYLPAALGTADILPMPLSALLAILVCGVAALLTGLVLLRRRSRSG